MNVGKKFGLAAMAVVVVVLLVEGVPAKRHPWVAPKATSSSTAARGRGRDRQRRKIVSSDARAAFGPMPTPMPPHQLRGGASCSDATTSLLAKLGITGLAQAAALLGILVAGPVVSAEIASTPTVLGESAAELLASFAVVFGGSFVGAIVGGGLNVATNQSLQPSEVPGDPEWYGNLSKPSWTPPGFVFPIMWLVVSKPTQLCALSRIFKHAYPSDPTGARTALAVYAAHLALGDAWNKVFFGLECIGLGTVVISMFWIALLSSAYLFYRLDPGAGYYLLPTCGWVTVATALQYSIYGRNKKPPATAK